MLVTCSGCRKRLNIDENLADEMGRCPACNAVIRIPTPDQVYARQPGDPPAVAEVVPEDELSRLGVVDEPAPDPTDVSSTASAGAASPGDESLPPLPAGVRVDSQGLVLAVPVEDEPVASASQAGSDIPGPEATGHEMGYDLADEEDAPPPPAEKIITRCPGCGGMLAIEPRYAGKMRTCPKCSTEIQVPFASTEEPSLSGPPAMTMGSTSGMPAIPDASAEDLADDVDLESYVTEPEVKPARGVAVSWIVVAFLVGATIGFVAGWFLSSGSSGASSAPAEPASSVQVDQTG